MKARRRGGQIITRDGALTFSDKHRAIVPITGGARG
jgi:hypothetical protein